MRRRGNGALVWASLDLLTCLLLATYVLVSPGAKRPVIETPGQYAVAASWRDGSNDDIDLWVQNPTGGITWYGMRQTGLVLLESDDCGEKVSGTHKLSSGRIVKVPQRRERAVIKGVLPGEYVANVRMYHDRDGKPIRVHVELWNLQGDDKVLLKRDVTLITAGHEETAFRFSFSLKGFRSWTTLPKKLAGTRGTLNTTGTTSECSD